jgi:hypothetical protein
MGQLRERWWDHRRGTATGGSSQMTNQLLRRPLIKASWFVRSVNFDATSDGSRLMLISRTRFTHPKVPGEHPVHDTQIRQLRPFFCRKWISRTLLRLPQCFRCYRSPFLPHCPGNFLMGRLKYGAQLSRWELLRELADPHFFLRFERASNKCQ